jgi:hypothetical protein
MKTKVLVYTLGLLLLAFLFYDPSSGVAAVQRTDRTGSPVSLSDGCNACHGGGNFNTSVSVEVLQSNSPVTNYEPSQPYTVRVTVNSSNNPSGYGFQVVALVAEDNSNAGSFGMPPDGTQITTLNNRQYFEHSRRNTINNWSIEWTAPPAGTGEVRFYAAANAVNGNGSNTGDSPARLSTPLILTEEVTSGFTTVEELNLQVAVYPNPVQDHLRLQISNSENGRFSLRLLNAAGQLARSGQVEVVNGRSDRQLPVQDLPGGLYFLYLSDGQKVKATTMVKE